MRFIKRLFHRHHWISDLPLSTDGMFAVVAGLWMPPSTCRCAKKHPGVNKPWDKWVDLKRGWRGRVNPL